MAWRTRRMRLRPRLRFRAGERSGAPLDLPASTRLSQSVSRAPGEPTISALPRRAGGAWFCGYAGAGAGRDARIILDGRCFASLPVPRPNRRDEGLSLDVHGVCSLRLWDRGMGWAASSRGDIITRTTAVAGVSCPRGRTRDGSMSHLASQPTHHPASSPSQLLASPCVACR